MYIMLIADYSKIENNINLLHIVGRTTTLSLSVRPPLVRMAAMTPISPGHLDLNLNLDLDLDFGAGDRDRGQGQGAGGRGQGARGQGADTFHVFCLSLSLSLFP